MTQADKREILSMFLISTVVDTKLFFLIQFSHWITVWEVLAEFLVFILALICVCDTILVLFTT